jgi:hypothetical protein
MITYRFIREFRWWRVVVGGGGGWWWVLWIDRGATATGADIS